MANKTILHATPQSAARQSNIEKATAPYNFVSLPSAPLVSEIASVEDFKKHIQNCERISGEIELDIEALTPLFIGESTKSVKSFSPAGKFIIPGSSLRGMFKNIFKIVTCSTFRGSTSSQKKGEDFNDEHIYYRCIMKDKNYLWTQDLNKLYTDQMVDKKSKSKKARPGFLIRDKDNKYFIAPLDKCCDEGKISIHDKKFADLEDSCIVWDGIAAYIFTGKGGKKKHVRYTEITDINPDKNSWLKLFPDKNNQTELLDEDSVLESYEHDRNRRGVNLLDCNGILNREQIGELCKTLTPKMSAIIKKILPEISTLVPCHYICKNNKVTAFGHGQCFRIPYEHSIGNIVPEKLNDKKFKIIDFTDAVFGMKENWASRVFFEDATPKDEIETLESANAHPLMQPNPTSYQLYLKQDDDAEILKHWDSDNAKLRGYKLYWHNNPSKLYWQNKPSDWKASKEEEAEDEKRRAANQEPILKNLTPLKQGSKFQSRIRFENLSKVELGALLMIFDLNGAKNPAYKIGMAKSLGFGSIKINSQLYIEDTDAYTAEIFDDNGFKSPYSASNAQDYINAFKNYVNGKIGLTAWQKVMDELNAILDWENKPDSKNIAPMGNVPNERGQMDLDNRLRQRVSLPNIFEVLK